jgi:6-phosphogluconolactonase
VDSPTGRDVELVVAGDAEGAARRVAERLAEAANAGGHIVLTGGSTPRRAYETAAALEPDWSRVELWWGDERCVPVDDERSNFALAKAALLDRVGHEPRRVHRMRGELGLERGAALYEAELGALVRFDLVLLGLGSDGHVASLFPRQPTLDESERRVVGAEAQLGPFVDRITLTLPALRAAGEVLFLVTGEDKAEAARRAFAGEPSTETPGSLVRAEGGRTVAVLDRAAAATLQTGQEA